jgi:hypothetical protein
MLSGRGNSRTMGSAVHVRRPFWRAKLTRSAPIGSWVSSSAWHRRAYSSPAKCRNARQFDPIAAAGGLAFFAIMGFSAYAEWLAAVWLIRTLGG